MQMYNGTGMRKVLGQYVLDGPTTEDELLDGYFEFHINFINDSRYDPEYKMVSVLLIHEHLKWLFDEAYHNIFNQATGCCRHTTALKQLDVYRQHIYRHWVRLRPIVSQTPPLIHT